MARKRTKKPKQAVHPLTIKAPRHTQTPTPLKSARSHHIQSSNDETPSWRFSRLELVAPFGWHVIDTKLLHYIRGKLQQFESMTWNQILVESQKQNHSIPVHMLCKQARDRLAELRLDDIEDLVSLRISGKQRVWGIRQKSAFLLLWWDPDHQVYPSKKKHT